MEDMNRAMARQHRDFRRGLHQQREDFNIMMNQQAEDFETQQRRQLKQYNTTMDRAAEDMAHMADEVLGNIEDVLVKSSKRLTGSAQEQARLALKAFRDLKKDTTPEAVALMQELAEVFGFDYKNPLKGGGGGSSDPYAHGSGYPGSGRGAPQAVSTPYYAGGFGGPSNGMPRAEGGMVPGWTPGRDIYNVHLSGGEAIMRPEWARAVGPQIIDAMNHQAKHGGFAAGGVFWPVPGHRTGTYPGHDGVDINRGSGSDDYGDPIRAFRSGRIVYVGTQRGYGEAIFEATRAGTVVYGHTSSQNVHAGQQVQAGQLIGRVGSTGNSSAPHLHFGIPGGTTAQALALLNGAILGGFAGGDYAALGPRKTLSEVVKDLYPRAEAAAANMKGVHPLFPGDISKVINRFVRRKYRQLDRRFGATGPGILDIGREPSGHLDNEQIVRTGANRMGWEDQWAALRQIVMHESGFNNTAQNPTSTAYGMFQFLDSTWPSYGVKKTSDPWQQTQAGLRYIKERYGDPRGAWRFWKEHNWYGDGAMFDAPNLIGVGERGPEAVIPLNDKGGEFLARSIGLTTSAMGGGINVSNYRIDRSTNFTGPITVQANDPNELLAKLQARQRVRALSRPVLTGSAA
jgi:murein DD-endopeptidase MepM/ murein hydrolase activator NlpD